MIILPDVAPRVPRGKLLQDKFTLTINAYWIMYMGKIYGIDRI